MNIYGTLPSPVNFHYFNRYIKLLDYCKNNNSDNNNYEIHHILPKSMGGDNSPSNLIKLTPRQHFIAHFLLWKTYRNKKMMYAFWLMSNNNQIKSSKIYSNIRASYIESITGDQNYFYGKHFIGELHPSYGKPKSEKFKKQRSIEMTGQNNHFFGKQHPESIKKLISDIAKNRWNDSGYRDKMLKSLHNRDKIKCPALLKNHI